MNIADVRGHGMEYLVRGQDVLFNLAGQVSHIDSMSDPLTDLEINCASQLRLLEAVRRGNPDAEDRLRGHAPDLRQAALPAGRRGPPAPAGGRQRHQQDLGRVLPPRLPPGVRHSRVLAAPDEHLRPAAAHPPQPPGVHRLVRPPGRLRRGDPRLRRRTTAPRLQPRRRRGRRVSSRGGHGRRRRAGDEPGRRAGGVAPRPREACFSTSPGAGATGSCPSRRRGSASTSATSTPTRGACARRSAGRRACPCATGSRATIAYYRETPGALPVTGPGVPFVDFRAHVAALRGEIDVAVARVLDSGWFILGPEGEAFERELAAALGARDAVAVANGTDALHLALRALGVGAGDEVVTTSLSAAFTALAIVQAGARPVFVDVDAATLNLDPRAVARRPHPADEGDRARPPLRPPRRPAADPRPRRGARDRRPRGRVPGPRRSLPRPAGRHARPARRALLLPDEEPRRPRRRRRASSPATPTHAARLRRLAQRRPERPLPARGVRGQQPPRRDAGGHPARLAAAPARVDRAPPRDRRVLPARARGRRPRAAAGAGVRDRGLSPVRGAPPAARRARGGAAARTASATLIHYPIPLHHQPAFAPLAVGLALPNVERAAAEILSLPLYPELTDAQAAAVVAAVRRATAAVRC